MLSVFLSATWYHIMYNTASQNILTNNTFSQLPLNSSLLTNLASLNHTTMTPIQAKSLPLLLNGDDIIAKAQTGSGKTAAFGLTILNKVNLKFFAVQALVLCPTRELAEQVCQSLRQLARQMPNVKIINLSGGMPLRPQIDSLRHGAHIVIGTPGRIHKHLNQESLTLDKLTLLTLDEADRMLDMGFLDEIRSVIKKCPKNRQTILFSATYPSEIKQMAREFMRAPQEIFIEEDNVAQYIEQKFYELTETNKFPTLISVLQHYKSSSTLIFCNTRQRTMDVGLRLQKAGFSAIVINGEMEQTSRDLAIIQFINKSYAILVATDIAARGLDIKELPLVINYEVAFEPEVHTHRIGRTGRAGVNGRAITFTTTSDANLMCAIENITQQPIKLDSILEIKSENTTPYVPQMITLCLNIGKKDKIRAGDILGALTKDAALPGDAIGKINVLPLKSYIAINKNIVAKAIQYFKMGKIKGRTVGAKIIVL